MSSVMLCMKSFAMRQHRSRNCNLWSTLTLTASSLFYAPVLKRTS